MSEPAKFVLNDKLWRDLPLQYLQDSLLCSTPKDAAKWIVVSKYVKEFIERNRDKMPRFKGYLIALQTGRQTNVELCDAWPVKWHNVDCGTSTEVSTPSSPILEYISKSESSMRWRLTDTSVAGMQRFIKLALDWFAVENVRFNWRCSFDVEVLRPLADSGVCIGFNHKDEVDEDLLDVIENLHIRNIDFRHQDEVDDSCLHCLRDMSLETVQIYDIRRFKLLQHLDCSVIRLRRPSIRSSVFADIIVKPWLKGERPRLMMMTFTLFGDFDCSFFDPVDFVPTAVAAKRKRRVFLLIDKKEENVMEVNVDLIAGQSNVKVLISTLD